ncbi:glycosyltransferase family 4 protein [Neobacillus rhizophilus]|uniref:Glycosyltransferase family 4 protein n=1 Tax=Neobacillus rhizophilus TaxID=2833579 RepID=A0A942YV68_9BACI|nr:glycosyltransferase family 4 protein [Neobacillus rhizophilus]MBS4212685.1 glycosyltransferase family 4 protein [Neobacillus rhizophilus]
MRILFLSAANSIHTVRWVNAFAENGHEVHLAYNSDHAPQANNINKRVVQHKLKYSGFLAYYLNSKEMKTLFKKVSPQIVNAHYASGYGTLARISKLKPLILSVWGSDVYDFPYQSKIKMKILKRNLCFADKIASTSNCMAKKVKEILGAKSVDIAITPFGVDLKKFQKGKKKDSLDFITIGNVKALNPLYGISDLIISIRLLKDNLEKENMQNVSDRIRLFIYGEGNQKDELIELTKKYNLQNSITFKGKIPNSEVPKALKQFDIFCATSIKESFGVALVEAMAMSLPVVATDAEGFKEVVVDEITGIIVEKENPVSIANGLKRLVLNEELRRKMGEEGRIRVEEYYNWTNNVDTMERLYDGIISAQ